VLNIVGVWMDDNDADTHIGWVRDAWDRIRLHSTGDPYLNFLGDEGTASVRAAYGAEPSGGSWSSDHRRRYGPSACSSAELTAVSKAA
jgi:hypothetical protein